MRCRITLAALLVFTPVMLTPVLFAPVLSTAVLAHDNGQFGNVPPEIRAWFKSVKSHAGVPCCDIADGHRTDYDMRVSKYWVPINGEWIDRMDADAEELAAKTKSAFMDATKRQGIALDKETSGAASATWRQEIGNASRLVSRRARFFDIVVLGRSDRVVEEPHSDTIEETLIHSGRPVLLAPTRAPATLGDVIAIGWNGSPEAVRVLSASLPLLGMAKRVFIITVGDKHEASAADLTPVTDRERSRSCL